MLSYFHSTFYLAYLQIQSHHHAYLRMVPYLPHNRQIGSYLYHAPPQLLNYQNHEVGVKTELIFDCRADANQYLAHREYKGH